MKIVAISDTHTYHDKVTVPECDILLHGGDFTYDGRVEDVMAFNEWLGKQPAKHKIVIAGNHDMSFDSDDLRGGHYYGAKKKLREEYNMDIEPWQLITNAIYLNDSGVIVDGLKIWGSPIQPWFHNWAFNRMRGSEINEHWQLIPADTDILITHGPPFGILDKPFGKQAPVGCEDLARKVEQIQPKLHVFGHIHGSYGTQRGFFGTLYVNASVVDEAYNVRNLPVVICSKCWETSDECEECSDSRL